VRLEEFGRVRATIVQVLRDPDAVVLRVTGKKQEQEVTVPLDEARDATLVVDWSEIERSMSKPSG
jgi:hypothetical protein